MKEADLVAQLEKFVPYYYTRNEKEVRYPESIGIVTPVSPPYGTNCTAFLEGLIIPVARKVDGAEWSVQRHRDFTIRDPERKFSIVDALDSIAVRIDEGAVKELPHWTVVQGWTKLWTRGHQVVVVRHEAFTDKCLILEASSVLGGPGWRSLGHIKRVGCKIPENWQETVTTTLEGFLDEYPHYALMALDIT